LGEPDYVLTSLADAVDANLADALARDAAGWTTLRAAVQEANNEVGAQTIWLPAWRLGLSLTALEPTNNAASDDLDIRSAVTIQGAGPGLSIIDASGLATNGNQSDDRIFDVHGGSLNLAGVTLLGGNVSGNGGAMIVHTGGSLVLDDSALVENRAAGYGGAISILSTAGSVAITDSVLAGNLAPSGGGGIRNDKAGVTIGHTVFADNSAFANRNDVFNTGTGSMFSLGYNMLTEISTTAPGLSDDYQGNFDFLVTTVADSFFHLDDAESRSLREALDSANASPGGQEIWIPGWRLLMTLAGAGGLEQGDYDITNGNSVTIRGTGAGSSMIDAFGLATSPDRIFEVTDAGLSLSRLTLTGGNAATNGGAILVGADASLFVDQTAFVENRTNAGGGAIAILSTAGTVTITSSVFTANTASAGGGAVRNEKPGVVLNSTIVANNTGPVNLQGLINVGGGSYASLGNMRFSEISSTTPELIGEFLAPVNHLVTSVVDAVHDLPDRATMTLRDAIKLANDVAGAEEIWLPNWEFLLSLVRNGQATDTSVAYGDLDIEDSLTIRGIYLATRVAWRVGAPQDRIFELLGDFNNELVTDATPGNVDLADYIVWRRYVGTGEAFGDADDDGDTDANDYAWWGANWGNSLMLWGIQ
jgi:hypothetical protein